MVHVCVLHWPTSLLISFCRMTSGDATSRSEDTRFIWVKVYRRTQRSSSNGTLKQDICRPPYWSYSWEGTSWCFSLQCGNIQWWYSYKCWWKSGWPDGCGTTPTSALLFKLPDEEGNITISNISNHNSNIYHCTLSYHLVHYFRVSLRLTRKSF